MTPIETALAAVPEHIEQVRDLPWHERITEADWCLDMLAANAVMLWWPESERRKQKRHAGKPMRDGYGTEPDPDDVTTALARGLAILACRPHGVEFGGLHLCDNKHDGECPTGELRWSTDPENHNARGATFTPRKLAEDVAEPCLEAVVYQPGPVQTANTDEWRLLPPEQILTKRCGDIAVGSGVFLVAAVRYLAQRLAEHLPESLRTPSVVPALHRAVITHCVYGTDIHPGSVTMCRIVLALMCPHVDVDTEIYRRIQCGDALLGITSLDQLRWMHMHPERGREIHGLWQPVSDELIESALRGGAA